MDAKPRSRSSGRETLLTFSLLGLVALAVIVFLIGILGTLVFEALLLVGIIAFFGAFHYVVWGHSLSRQVETERREQEELEETPVDPDAWPPEDRFGTQRYR
jgi:hypothetical protein